MSAGLWRPEALWRRYSSYRERPDESSMSTNRSYVIKYDGTPRSPLNWRRPMFNNVSYVYHQLGTGAARTTRGREQTAGPSVVGLRGPCLYQACPCKGLGCVAARLAFWGVGTRDTRSHLPASLTRFCQEHALLSPSENKVSNF